MMGENDRQGNDAMKATTRRTATRPRLLALAAAVALAGLFAATGAAHASSQQEEEMAPNSVLGVDGTVGARLETPADGRLRGYGFTARLDSIGTAEAVEDKGSTLQAAAGQRLVIVALRFDPTIEDSDHPIHATVVVDGRRTSLPDGDFVRSGELLYAASVPSDAARVEFELAAAGYAQTFSLTNTRRVGEQPAVLYRDPVTAEPSTDLNAERTVAASDERQRGAVRILLRRVRLSWFSPGEPITTPPSPDQAFLIIEGEGDGVQPPYGSDDYGRYFSKFEAMPIEAVTATLPDGTSLTAQRGGPTEGLLGGAYYFTVPADLGSAKLALGPATVRGSHYRGFIGEPSTIHIEETAEFGVTLPAGATPVSTPSTAEPTTTTGPRTADAAPAASESSDASRGSLLWWLLALAILAVVAVGVWRRRTAHSRGAVPADVPMVPVPAPTEAEPAEESDDEDDDAPVMVLGLVRRPLKRIEGPGAVAAVRAGLAYMISTATHDPETERDRVLLVVTRGGTERLLPPDAPLPPWVHVVPDEAVLFTEIEVAHIRFARLAEEHEQDRDAGRWQRFPQVPMLTVVMPGPDDPEEWNRLRSLQGRSHNARYAMTVVCVGGEFGPWVRVEADGRISTSDETLPADMQAWMLTEAEASARLARSSAQAPEPDPEPTNLARPAQPTPSTVATGTTEPAVTVRLLGTYMINADGTEVATGLRSKARELLAYLAVNRDGATADAAVDALFPDTTADKGQDHFRTVVANLRTTLRSAATLPDGAAIVERMGSRYRLDARHIGVDVWRFEDALAAAVNGDESAASAAPDCYAGDFADGEDYTWAEPIRERFRRKAIDHLSALADRRRATGDLDEALRAAERATELDPYAEELYRSVISLQHVLGRGDAARRTYQLLERRLREIGLQPSPQAKAALERSLS